MLFRRIVDTVFTFVLLACILVLLLYSFFLLSKNMRVLEQSKQSTSSALPVIIVVGIVISFLGIYSVIYWIVKFFKTGNGILCRKVKQFDFLMNRGVIVHSFPKDTVMWRFSRVFRKGVFHDRSERSM